MAERTRWDRGLGLGLQKIFEVRRIHSDATFLDEFLTPEFCQEQKLFVRKQDPRAKPQARQTPVPSHEFNEIKQVLLFQFTNGGRPVIELVDANHANRSELLLRHRHVGVDLRWDWAKEVLEGMVQLWKRPVRLETMRGGKWLRVGHDGTKPSEEFIQQEQSV
jgi:stage V sporulation protein R